jgi:hypothetical protein
VRMSIAPSVANRRTVVVLAIVGAAIAGGAACTAKLYEAVFRCSSDEAQVLASVRHYDGQQLKGSPVIDGGTCIATLETDGDPGTVFAHYRRELRASGWRPLEFRSGSGPGPGMKARKGLYVMTIRHQPRRVEFREFQYGIDVVRDAAGSELWPGPEDEVVWEPSVTPSRVCLQAHAQMSDRAITGSRRDALTDSLQICDSEEHWVEAWWREVVDPSDYDERLPVWVQTVEDFTGSDFRNWLDSRRWPDSDGYRFLAGICSQASARDARVCVSLRDNPRPTDEQPSRKRVEETRAGG